MPASEIKERPILMSAPMIRALLSGTKTQTRRIAKFPSWVDRIDQDTDIYHCGTGVHPSGECESPKCLHMGGQDASGWPSMFTLKCPYGKVGERLWVRENYRFEKFFEIGGIDDWAATVYYPADNASRQIYQCDAPEDVGFWPGAAIRRYEGKNRPCIFMYRWVSRITLEITELRVERLQDISDEDCIAEGIGYVPQLGIMRACGWQDYSGKTVGFLSPRDSYRSLWESINGAGSWDLSPWVFVIAFSRL